MSDRQSDIRGLLEANAVRLPDEMSVADVAAKCRGATLMLLESEHIPWGKQELAEWLAGPYRSTTTFANARPIGIPASSRRMPIRSQQIAELLREARAEALAAFKRVAGTGDISFSFAAVHGGFIERCQDSIGSKGWVPVDREGMRFSERVLSLIAVDYLVRPADYLGELSVCEVCERVTFHPLCRAKKACHQHRAVISVLPRPQKTTA